MKARQIPIKMCAWGGLSAWKSANGFRFCFENNYLLKILLESYFSKHSKDKRLSSLIITFKYSQLRHQTCLGHYRYQLRMLTGMRFALSFLQSHCWRLVTISSTPGCVKYLQLTSLRWKSSMAIFKPYCYNSSRRKVAHDPGYSLPLVTFSW